ncbi:hypothetical protein [Azospirillum soli]|uniref:hypothetical protein n=1 Tax=Azospirillum soli TaxID=1304799 RepID=UPI001AE61EF5|nr:hypothetical protein [Azospirillum soli]MBP2316906.1 hypothetical protein [Azospirillum soli]
MMISGQSAVTPAASTVVANKDAKAVAARSETASAPAPSDVSQAAGGKKDFATVAKDARSAIDAAYKKVGVENGASLSLQDRLSVFSTMDRRSLYAVASNAGGHFSKEEQFGAADAMELQFQQARGIDPFNPATIPNTASGMAAASKAGIKFLDSVSDEEKQSVTWAAHRATAQNFYEAVSQGAGETPENLDSDNPLVKVLKAAMTAGRGDPARDRTEGRMDTLEGLKKQPWAKGFEAQIDQAFRESARQGSLLDRKV